MSIFGVTYLKENVSHDTVEHSCNCDSVRARQLYKSGQLNLIFNLRVAVDIFLL
jgi:hypothetical protein